MRVLVVNIFFDPATFGGATIVAENLAAELHRRPDFDVMAVSANFGQYPAATTYRYRSRLGFDAFCIGLPVSADGDTRIANSKFDDAFIDILEFAKPDVVHVHCTQDIGCSFFDELEARGIPFAVTVHDFWQLCARQFMIDVNGEFCNQRKIDFRRCADCIGSAGAAARRSGYLTGQLDKADMILTPSAYAREMLVENGLDRAKVQVNKNGVYPPVPDSGERTRNWSEGPVRVGFLGGPGNIKGWDLIVEALKELPHARIKILAVDAGANVGQPWREGLLEGTEGLPIEVLPGFSPDHIDRAFSQFDAVICPARWKETFGLVAREAHIRGLWVIAADAGGLAEDIRDGESGRVMPFPPKVDDVRKALLELIEKPDRPVYETDNIQTVAGQADELARWLTQLMQSRLTEDVSS